MSKRKATIELENSRKPKVATSEKCHDALLSSLFGCIYGCECAVCTNSKNNMHTDNGYVQEKYLSDHVIDADMQRKEVIDANYDRGILALHFKTLSDNKLVNFAPKTAHDLCTCTWQTVIRSHHGPCSQTARASALICPNQSRHEMFKLIEGDTLYTYVPFYLNTETNYPMSSFANQNETFRRLNFIESLVLTNYLSSSSSILNAALPCKDLLTIITDYTVETPQICAEKWFVALPIKGARIVAKYAFVYLQNSQKDKEKDPYKPLPAVYHQSFRESVLRRFNEHDISLVKLMQQCLPIHFQMMTWQYQTMVAIPPSSQNSTNTFDDTECAKSFCIELQKWDMLCKKKPQIYLRRLNSLRNLLSTNENEDKIQTSRLTSLYYDDNNDEHMVMIPQKFQHKLLSLKLTILAETYNNMDPNEIESKGNDYSYSTIYGELQDVGSDFIDNDIDQYDHFVQNTNDKRNSFKSRRLAADNTLGHLIKQCNANKIGLNFDLLPYQTAIQMRVADETNQLIGMIEWNAWYKLFEVHHVKNNKFATTFVEKEKFLNYLLHWKTRFLNSIDQ